MADSYDKGTLIVLSAEFRDLLGEDADPTDVILKVQDPSGNEETFTYLLGQVTRDSKGHYHRDHTVDESGTWYYNFTAIGAVETAAEEEFYVRRSEF